MKMFRCGCQLDGTRCARHRDWGCHSPSPEFYRRETRDGKVTLHPIQAEPVRLDDGSIGYLAPKGSRGGECPVCFLARLRSVSLSAKATPTRTGR